MSGLFRYNSNATPLRRNNITLRTNGEDATMDNSFAFGYRSPSAAHINIGGGNTSPGQGRSLREYDEKLNALQKENFNLKLRLFFLEENSPATGGNGNGATKNAEEESLFKQNIDLKVENEELRKELQSKQELLMQAAKVMELMEETQRKSEDKSSSIIADLSNKNQSLEDEIRSLEKTNSIQSPTAVSSTSYTHSVTMESDHATREDEKKIAQLEQTASYGVQKLSEMGKELEAAHLIISQQKEVIKNYGEKIEQMKLQIIALGKVKKEFVNNPQTESEIVCGFKKQIQELKSSEADYMCTIQDLEEKLASTKRAHDKSCKTIQILLVQRQELDEQIQQLKSGNDDNVPSSSKNSQNDEIKALKEQLLCSQNEIVQINQWRNQCLELCNTLMNRLSEMAGFLDTLLKHKDVLSVLAQDRHKAMRKAIDQSLDLSRSINNLSGGGCGARFSLTERSLLQISNLTEILNDSYFDTSLRPDDIPTNKDSSIIASLRAEVETLKSELEKVNVDNHKNKPNETPESVSRRERISRNLSQQFDANSESESWSEPDRKVSSERIGLDDSNKQNVRSPCALNKFKGSSTSSISEENVDSRSTRKNTAPRLQERINDLEAQLSEKCILINELQAEKITSEPETQALRDTIKTLNAQLADHREENRQLRDRLHDIRERYEQARIDWEKTIEEYGEFRDECLHNHQDEIDRLREKLDEMEDEHSRQIDMLESQESVKLELLQQQLNKKYEEDLKAEIKRIHSEARIETEKHLHHIDELEKRLVDSESLLQLMRENETELKNQILEHEKINRSTKRSIDEISMQLSKSVLERNKFMNERDHFEKENKDLLEKIDHYAIEKSELHSKLAILAHDNAQLHNKLVSTETQFELTRSASQGNARYALTTSKSVSYLCEGLSSGGDQSDNASDDHKQRLENSSPDLGIDSDGTGRSSGTDANTSRSPKYRSPKSERLEEEDLHNGSMKSPNSGIVIVHHDCEKVEKENAELRRKLERTRRAFEKTWTQLRISNQRKEQIEKDIRQEIYKTHDVLKNVRSNMECANDQLRKPPTTSPPSTSLTVATAPAVMNNENPSK